jgi:hypothetical protein
MPRWLPVISAANKKHDETSIFTVKMKARVVGKIKFGKLANVPVQWRRVRP